MSDVTLVAGDNAIVLKAGANTIYMERVVALGGGGSGGVLNVGLDLPVSLFTVAGSPVTTAGTLTGSLNPQSPNTVFAGPGTGALAAVPTFRPLVAADLPVSGSVTSVGLSLPSIFTVTGSPVTAAGTLAASLNAQGVGTVLAGPVTGGAAAPAFRALVATDLPAGTGTVTSVGLGLPSTFAVSGSPVTTAGTLSATWASQAAATVLAAPPGGGTPAFRALAAGDLPVGTGTVTSVALALPSLFTVSGSPVTASGTLTGTLAAQSAGTVLAGPTSGSAAPSFRALAQADLPAGTGTVTSVALSLPSIFTVTGSPVSTAGTLTGALASQTANTVFAGPATGAAAAPAFRALVAADVPGGGGGGSGSVTSVALSLPGIFTVSGSPVTTAGTLTGTLASQAAGTVFAAPAGAAGTPTFRTLNATDLPSETGTVTSVGLALPAIFAVTGSPVTSSGTLTGALASQAANAFFAGPTTGGAAAPGFRGLVAADLAPTGAYAGGNLTISGSATITPNGSDPGFSNLLVFGSSGTAYQALKGSPTGLQVRYADDSALAPLVARTIASTIGDGTDAILAGGGAVVARSYRWFDGSRISNLGDGTIYLTKQDVTQAGVAIYLGPGASAPGIKNLGASGLSARRQDETTDVPFTALRYSTSGGAVALPAYNFGATGTGLHSAGTNQIALVTNSVQSLAVDALANITIGQAAAAITWTTRTVLTSPADGYLQVQNNANTGTGQVIALGTNTAGGGMRLTRANATVLTLTDGVGGFQISGQANRWLGGAGTRTPAACPFGSFNDVGAGLYFPTTNNVGLATNGLAALVFDGSANAVFAGTVANLRPYATKSANYTVAQTDANRTIEVSAASTLTLPAITTANMGMPLYVVATNAVVVTVAPNAADAIINAGVPLATGAALVSTGIKGANVALQATSANTWTVLGSVGFGSAYDGTVTSVGLSLPGIFTVTGSPVTASGTLTGTLASQPANTVFAAPNGAAGSPTFRALTGTDLPGGAGSGSVTSVALALPSIFSVTGSPVTTNGTLTGALTAQSANVVFAGPATGAADVPGFRALVAADVPGGGGGSSGYDETTATWDDHFSNYQNGSTVAVNGNIPPYWSVLGNGGTGAGVQVGQLAGTAGHPGIYGLTTGSTATGAIQLGAYFNCLVLGSGPARMEWIVRVPTLSTSTQRFTLNLGWVNTASAGTFSSGITWQYTDTVAGGNWTLQGAQQTPVDSGVTVVAGTWYRLSLRVNAAATSCGGYINGTLAATATAGLTGGAVTPAAMLVKSVGTTASVVQIDRFWMQLTGISPT